MRRYSTDEERVAACSRQDLVSAQITRTRHVLVVGTDDDGDADADDADEADLAPTPAPAPTPTPAAAPEASPSENSPPPPPPKSLTSPPSPPPSVVCSTVNMVAGCECASDGFGHGKPDNPLASTGLCCDESTKKTVKGTQMQSSVKCVKYSPPPRLPPPMPPPPSPPPGDVCSKDNMVAGCKCASQGFGNGKPDNPFESTGLCCSEATKKTVKGAQMQTSVKCVKYSPPPRPPPLMPPPPSPPPVDICSKDNMVTGCKCGKYGGGSGLADNPSTNQGCCNRGSRTFVAAGAQCMSW